VRAEMVQVLALEVDLGPAAAFGQVGAEIERIGTARELLLVILVFLDEVRIIAVAFKSLGQFVQDVLDRFGDELSAVGAKKTVGCGHGHEDLLGVRIKKNRGQCALPRLVFCSSFDGFQAKTHPTACLHAATKEGDAAWPSYSWTKFLPMHRAFVKP
jgi:hypothetical protein